MNRLTIVFTALAGLVLGVAADQVAMRTFLKPKPPPVAAATRSPPAPPAPVRAAPAAEDPKAVYKVTLDDSPVRGPKTALVTIVEVSDFECPFCKKVAPTLQQLETAYGDKLRFVFKQNPLAMHANAVPAAKLAEEARAQGGDARFWAMHDKLFSLAALDRASLEKAAQELKLSPGEVKEALDTQKHLPRIQRDQTQVNTLGARGTPSFFINGRKLVGAQPLEAFKAVVDEELKKAEALVASGVARGDVYARIIEKGATAPVMLPGAPAGSAAPPPAQPPPMAKVTLRPDDPVRGPKVAPVTLVLFSDFQCPFCGKVEPTLQQVRETYGDKVRIAWKHQPLPFHPNALPAAKAAEAARRVGKFWEMHDKLFANQAALSDAAYLQYAKELKFDAARFQRDLAAGDLASRITEDQQLASVVGAEGTPTMFVNCRRFVGAQPFFSFQAVIDEELKKAEKLQARGEKLDAGFYDKACAANVSGQLAAR